jgi:hypothetical protein
MARRWEPERNQPVGPKEAIGRRLFEEPDLVGAKDQKPKVLLDFRLFEEKRSPFEVSLDRLGARGPDDRVLPFLSEKAVKQGLSRKPAKTFFGWQHIAADLLANPKTGPLKFPVIASPVKPEQPNDPEHNPYHAHISPPIGNNGPCEPMTVALYLQMLFSKYGDYKPYHQNNSNSPFVPEEFKRTRFLSFIKAIWSRIQFRKNVKQSNG